MFTIGIIAIIVLCGFVIAFHRMSPSNRKTLEFYASALVATGALVGILITALQLYNSVEHERKAAAFSFNDKWQELSQTKLFLTIEHIQDIQANAKIKDKTLEISTFLRQDTDANEVYMKMLNFFEQLGMAIKYDYADDAITCNYFLRISIDYYSTLSSIIDLYRKKDNEPGLYANYEWLTQHWSKGCPS